MMINDQQMNFDPSKLKRRQTIINKEFESRNAGIKKIMKTDGGEHDLSDIMPDEGSDLDSSMIKDIKGENLEILRASNHFLLNNGNVQKKGPILENIEIKEEAPKVEVKKKSAIEPIIVKRP